jgi:hypothetical protein
MHMEKGSITRFETEDDAKDADYGLSLDERIAEALKKIPRNERLAILKGPHRLAKLPGMTDDDVHKLRNAAKRARRAGR